jgi:hypothetical protein
MCLGDAFVYRGSEIRSQSFDAYIQPFNVSGFRQFHAYLWGFRHGC